MPNNISRRKFLNYAVGGAGGIAIASLTSEAKASQTSLKANPVNLTFPKDFLWGTATSAYQIEGAAKQDGRGESIWDRFSYTPGKTKNGDTGDKSVDHYNRIEQDLDLMKKLNIKTYRFSISWPRIIPDGKGQVNQKGLDFYKRLVEGLNKRNIIPMATLFHWDLPQALQDIGGWENRDMASYFADYAAIVFDNLGSSIPLWLTLNEPKTVMNVGYVYGVHAPGFTSKEQGYTALHHMLLGHGMAVQRFRNSPVDKSKIGIALDLTPVYPAIGAENPEKAVYKQDGSDNRLFLDPVLKGKYPEDLLTEIQSGNNANLIKQGDLEIIGTKLDLLGINYYKPTYVTPFNEVVAGPGDRSQASWQEIYPDGLYDILVRVKKDYGNLPIYITENGAPFLDKLEPANKINDIKRLTFIYNHLAAAHRAIKAGVNLKGYYVWSLMDNFEWAEGYSQRWGIVYIDYPSLQRIPKRSALWYSGVIRSNRLGKLPG
jgi:beta-glucosidase